MTEMFARHITKEEINQMPVTEFGGEVVVVNMRRQLADAVGYLSEQTVVGVDTETRPSFTRGQHYPTALVQIATLERCYLFQINRIGMPPALTELFENPAILKVGLAFKDDLNGLRRLHQFEPHNCVDIQSMVNNYGIFDLGLQKIYAILFGEKISKSQQLTNWDTPRLTPEQAHYASTDAWATLKIYLALKDIKPLSRRRVEQMKAEERELMIRHQQEVLSSQQHSENITQAEGEAESITTKPSDVPQKKANTQSKKPDIRQKKAKASQKKPDAPLKKRKRKKENE